MPVFRQNIILSSGTKHRSPGSGPEEKQDRKNLPETKIPLRNTHRSAEGFSSDLILTAQPFSGRPQSNLWGMTIATIAIDAMAPMEATTTIILFICLIPSCSVFTCAAV